MSDDHAQLKDLENSERSPVPVRIGTREEFSLVLQTLRDASFDENTICRTFALNDMSDVGHLTLTDIENANTSRQMKLLARLFLVLTLTPRPDVEQTFDKSTINSFQALGLLAYGDFGDNFYANVLLAPVDGFLIASDRLINPDGSPLREMPDIVFPAIYQGTLQFLRLLPAIEGADVLDLCAGTGIAALSLSRLNQRAFSVDITPRASAFARFNKALNSCENVEILEGDLYAPVAGQSFNCIVAHPPYVPSLSFHTVWRDGGLTGESFIQRIVSEIPRYLRPGGYALILAQGVDTREGQFEERARQWLCESAHEFDIIFADEKDRGPGKVLELLGRKTGGDVIRQLRDAFEAAGVANMPYGALFLRRTNRLPQEAGWTIRTRLSPETTGNDVQSTFAIHDRVTTASFEAGLARATPRLAPHLEVQVTHVVHEGSLVPSEYIFATNRPFAKRVRMDDWSIGLFMRFDGNTTVHKVYEAAEDNAELPQGFALNDFVLLVTRSIEAGFLILPECDVSWAR